MNRKKERLVIILGILAMAICTFLMWDISRFLGVILLLATVSMIGMYVAVAIESTSDDSGRL